MPAPAKTSDERVLAAARKLVEQRGADALSMQALAARVGVRAPSLYKRFPDRDAILDGVLAGVLLELSAELRPAAQARTAGKALRQLAVAYRGFAHRHPHLYALLFARRRTPQHLVDARAAVVAPLLDLLAEGRDRARALPAARTLVAWLHGFVSMELDGAFHLGGEVDQAFAYGLDTLLPALLAS